MIFVFEFVGFGPFSQMREMLLRIFSPLSPALSLKGRGGLCATRAAMGSAFALPCFSLPLPLAGEGLRERVLD